MDSRYLYNHLTISWYVSISIATKVCQSFEYSSHNIINEHLCIHTIAMIKNNIHFKAKETMSLNKTTSKYYKMLQYNQQKPFKIQDYT